MSGIDELIEQLCPDGVEFKTLAEIGLIIPGLTGKNKDDFAPDGNALYVPYKNVFLNPALDLSDLEHVSVRDGEKQNWLEKGDIIFTASSEIAEEAGMTSVVTADPIQKIYLNSFCFIIRPFNQHDLHPGFAKHLFRSRAVRKDIVKAASGVTRFNVSKARLLKISVPVPPMEIQVEIARILDSFSELEAELEAELELRKKQESVYIAKLLSFDDSIKQVPLGSICIRVASGATPNKSKPEYYEGGAIPWLRTQEVKFNEITETSAFVTEKALSETAVKWVPANCVIVAISGASAGRCAVNSIPLTTNQHCLSLEIDPSIALYKFIYYCVRNQYGELLNKKEGARGDLNSTKIKKLVVSVPPLETQHRIVSILDKFDALVNDLSSGIPAEIEARRKQYEYYRDKLLTFKEKLSS